VAHPFARQAPPRESAILAKVAVGERGFEIPAKNSGTHNFFLIASLKSREVFCLLRVLTILC
jgi:hypothetical protein